ncbi:MAG: hypothetical protein ACPG5T_03625, partial [Endozoicomonas sp.]
MAVNLSGGSTVYVHVEEFELSPHNDEFIGDDGRQTIRPGKGNNTVWARGGDDTVICEGGRTEVWLEKGENTVFLMSGSHELHGGEGDDRIFFSGSSLGTHLIDGGGGDDQLVNLDRPNIYLQFSRLNDSTTPPDIYPECAYFEQFTMVIDLAGDRLSLNTPREEDSDTVNEEGEGAEQRNQNHNPPINEYKFSGDSVYRISIQIKGVSTKIEKTISMSEFENGVAFLSWKYLVGMDLPLDSVLEEIVDQFMVEVDVKWDPVYETIIKCFDGHQMVRATNSETVNRNSIQCGTNEKRIEEVSTTYNKHCFSKWQSSYLQHDHQTSSTIDLTFENEGKRQVKGIRTVKTHDGDDQLIGSPDEDNVLIGGNGDNQFTDMGGDNQFVSGMGDNWITAGSGYDSLQYTSVAHVWLKERPFTSYNCHSLYVNSAAGFVEHTWKAQTEAGKDRTFVDKFIGIDSIMGTPYRDTYEGASFGEHYATGGGNDSINLAQGDDLLVIMQVEETVAQPGASSTEPETLSLEWCDGGSGDDTVIFETLQGVRVDLSAGVAKVGDGGWFTLLNFERVTGSPWPDVLYGSDKNNQFSPRQGSAYGLSGDDYFLLSQGEHLISGGEGMDTVDYSPLELMDDSEGIFLLPDQAAFKSAQWLSQEPGFVEMMVLNQQVEPGQCPDEEGSADCRAGYGAYLSHSSAAPVSREFFKTNSETPAVKKNGTMAFAHSVKDRLYGIEHVVGSPGDDVIFLTVSQAVAKGGKGNDKLVDLSEGGTLIGGGGV